jgi:hypothetical protein
VLVTLDVARRIASLLSNALLFANAFVAQKVDEQQDSVIPSGGSGNIDLSTREALLRRRVYECFGALGFSTLTESMQSTLLQSVVSQFAGPDGYTGSSVQAAIATSSGSFTSVWHSADGYGSGVTSIDVVTQPLSSETDTHVQSEKRDNLNRDTIETSIDILVNFISAGTKPCTDSSDALDS